MGGQLGASSGGRRGCPPASLTLPPLPGRGLPCPPFPPPAGVRSLLSRMVHHAGGGSGGASSGAPDGYDLINLCSTFGSDPAIMAFAHVRRRRGQSRACLGLCTGAPWWVWAAECPAARGVLCPEAHRAGHLPRPTPLQLFCGGSGSGEGSGFRSRLPVAAAAFRDFCRWLGGGSGSALVPAGAIAWCPQLVPARLRLPAAGPGTGPPPDQLRCLPPPPWLAPGARCTSASPRRSPPRCRPTCCCAASNRWGGAAAPAAGSAAERRQRRAARAWPAGTPTLHPAHPPRPPRAPANRGWQPGVRPPRRCRSCGRACRRRCPCAAWPWHLPTTTARWGWRPRQRTPPS